MKLIFFNRKPGKNHFSLELLFREIPKHLPKEIEHKTYACTYLSKGIFPRLYNIYEAWKRQEENAINHITGDVHFLSLLLSKKHTILTIHDCNFINRATGLKKAVLKFCWLTLPLKKINYVTTISQATKIELVKHTSFSSDKIIVIPNFVAPHFVAVSQVFNKKKTSILQIGTNPNKNVPRLLEALQGLNVKLEIVGSKTARIIALLEKYKIEHRWSQNLTDKEILQKYIETDILAFVSTEEGFGLPIIEAQTVGRAVITSNISSMPEIAGKGACCINPLNKGSIRSGLLKIVNDDIYRKQIIEFGFKNAQRYQVENIVSAYVEVYKKCQ